MAEVEQAVPALLEEVQAGIYRKALDFREAHTWEVESYEALKEAVAQGFARAWWCGDPACEAAIKEETKATIRCLPQEQPGGKGRCIYCGKEAHEVALFGRAY
jgi:prolyl-tRNA synthetase